MHTMDAWMYRAERTSFGPSDEIYPPFGDPTVAKLAPVEWSMGNFCSYDNIISATTVGATENPSSIESGFPGIQETFFGNSIEELLESKIKEHAVTSPLPPFVKSAIREQEESSKDSSSVVDSNGQDSSLVDLKLGRLCDHRVSEDSKSLNDIGSDSSQASPAPVKRLRSTSLNGLTPFCQVHGCNMDLSNFKDYYKRHRVCQAHSKTAKVVVNSLQQRFCQQCSRFHLLSEFDDGKRSCRKRLAGHNARRRKPQISVHAGSTGMILQPYHGNHILGNAVSGRESFSQDMFTSSFSYEVNGESTNWCKHPNLDYASGGLHISKSTFNGQPHAKFITASHGMRKEFPFLNGDSMVGSIYNEYGSVAEVGLAASGSCFNIGSCVNGSPRVSGFSCARSLLSSQPQGLSISSSSCPISQPSISHVGNDQNNSSRCTTRVVPVGSQTSTNVVCSLGMNEVGDDHLGLLVSNVNNAVDLEVHTHKSLEEYQIANSKGMLSYNHGHTVNLLELSSLLHNAELRRRPLQVKEEFEPFIPIS